MPQKFNCPHCGAPNKYSGEETSTRCVYCGSDVNPPEEMVHRAAMARFRSKARPWIIAFIIIVFILPMCGTLFGVGASILGSLAAFFASFIGN
ncbi:MAG: hypothetical protein HFACDABA_02786 [Anaerolineales bacterium]|nr:hypothetical protein [Anaerolineales bacterium]